MPAVTASIARIGPAAAHNVGKMKNLERQSREQRRGRGDPLQQRALASAVLAYEERDGRGKRQALQGADHGHGEGERGVRSPCPATNLSKKSPGYDKHFGLVPGIL